MRPPGQDGLKVMRSCFRTSVFLIARHHFRLDFRKDRRHRNRIVQRDLVQKKSTKSGLEELFRSGFFVPGLRTFLSYSKKRDYIKQEIWARLILFNFCHAIIAETVPRHVKPNKKHIYQINISRAICICRQFLAAKEKAPPDIESLISRELLPIRTGRSDPRKVKTQSAVSFLYRIA